MDPKQSAMTTMLWKKQLLELVSEAPKPSCIECSEIASTNHKFSTPSASVSGSGDSESDLSGLSFTAPNEFETEGKTDQNGNERGEKLQKLANLIEVNLQIVDNLLMNNEPDKAVGSSVIGKAAISGESESGGERRRSCKTKAAPWHRPSIYFFNPFGPAFHGSLGREEVSRLLTQEGQFLVRKRVDDGDDEFVLTVRFNGRLKNFLINFDDTSGLIFMAGGEAPRKGFESLEELVQEGLTTMYLEHKAGPYIDLLYDLTRNEGNLVGKRDLALCLEKKSRGGPFTADCIFEFFDKASTVPDGVSAFTGKGKKGRFGGGNSNSKQNSPSPVSSLSGSSLERFRQPDLRSHFFKTHTFQQLYRCQICSNFLWGLSAQGLLCQHCGLTIHESCLPKVGSECEPDLSSLRTYFGVSLGLLVKASSGPPFLLRKCVSEIDKRGLTVEGIYRISGSREAAERLKGTLENDKESADLSTHSDMHSICSVVKQFLRELPESLITEEVFQAFLKGRNNTNPTNFHCNTSYMGQTLPSIPSNTATSNANTDSLPLTVDSVRRELKRLPPAHYVTLKYLLQHLHRVADRSELNKMNPFNLASVFAPSLFSPSQVGIETLQTGTHLLELMIIQVRNLFPK